jgi:homoprotocatechuate degradation regulator HpaR
MTEPQTLTLPEFRQGLAIALLRAREAVMARVRPMLRAYGLTEQQWRVLRVLADVEAMEAAQLARQAFLLRPSLTRILKDLQARGLIQRASAGAGLKKSLLSIAPNGSELLARTTEQAILIQGEIERICGAETIAQLKRDLDALETRLVRGS